MGFGCALWRCRYFDDLMLVLSVRAEPHNAATAGTHRRSIGSRIVKQNYGDCGGYDMHRFERGLMSAFVFYC